MLKKLSILIVMVAIVTVTNAQIQTPQPSPAATLEQVVGLTKVTVEYSRPSMRGRTIFGDLVPFGKVWRTGANANTKVTFSEAVTIGETELKKGTYALYTIPGETSWEIIFYSDANNWGTPQKWDESKVAAKVTAEVVAMPWDIQTFTMTIGNLTNDNAELGMLWEKVYVGVKFGVPTDMMATKSIESVMQGPSGNDYFQAASYYLASGKDLNKALKWMKKATEGDNPPFWYLRTMSLIQAELGDKAGAIATAKQSMASAEKAGNADYVKMNKESIAAWQN
jgi:hypothetical protein